MIAISSSSSTHIWINAFGIFMAATSLSSLAVMMHDNSMASVEMVGELASSLKMWSRYLFPPATVLPLRDPFHFSLRNT
jgi:hypothetical protein